MSEQTEHKQYAKRNNPMDDLPLFVNMNACAEATGIPLAVLKSAKREGCPAFRYSRINLKEFLQWWFARDPEGGIDWTKRSKRAEALTRELKLEESRDHVCDVAIGTRFLNALVHQCFFGELDRYKHEFPVVLKAKDEVAIFEEIGRQVELTKKAILAHLDRWNSGEARKE